MDHTIPIRVSINGILSVCCVGIMFVKVWGLVLLCVCCVGFLVVEVWCLVL